MLRLSVFLLLVLFHWSASSTDDDVVGGILYPRPSESREVRSLDGLWNFRIPPDEERYKGVAEGWYKQELWKTGDTIPMPVPASYNDIPTDVRYRRFFGLAWYQRDFFVPAAWSDRRVWVRFGSVFYAATVASISDRKDGGPLSSRSTGRASSVDGNKMAVSYHHSHLVYAGVIDYTVRYEGVEKSEAIPTVSVSLYDKDEKVVASSSGAEGRLEVSHAKFWWPYLMASEPAYMYQLQVTVKGSETDVYRLPVGIRTVSWDTSKVYINGKQLYLRGFGRHEDSHVRGKGLDLPLVIRDYNLIRWIGANGYRTSHYPYSEEIMDFSDQQGIVIIDECPIVSAHCSKAVGNDETAAAQLVSAVALHGRRHEDEDNDRHSAQLHIGVSVAQSTLVSDSSWGFLLAVIWQRRTPSSSQSQSGILLNVSGRVQVTMQIIGAFTPALWSDELLKNHKRSLTELVRRDKNRPSVIMWSVANEAETELEQAVAYFNMEQCLNVRVGETGDPQEGNPPTSGIALHDSYVRKSGGDPAGNRIRFALGLRVRDCECTDTVL
ncbi:hypothetical protein PR048_020584 [Dryococelus australis]|uniref:Beta-glucuronidase n=1 Tax=Dryococelus australis TaxID=614101 RepID=A0ABQ9H6P2_9NEOP|nr:hypothetical protein PR048_020584 [Dryococelus australis]